MGNVPISCCRSKSPRSSQDFRNGDLAANHENKYSISSEQRRKLSEKLSKHNDYGDSSTSSCIHQRTPSILQHISEREPDDTDTDPPLNSLNKTIFASGVRRKASSCSTIFIDNSTISQPDLDQTIRCVSLAIYHHIRNRTSDNSSGIFDESIHPLRMPNSSSTTTNTHDKPDQLIILENQIEKSSRKLDEPDQETIYNFVSTLFKAAELTSEYAITTLVYLERLMTYVEMDLTPNSWRRMFLGALLLSSKVWEDHAVWNVDYAQILEEISVDDINELERQFLEMIQFNMNVPSSVYAKYYFHLRTLALRNGFSEEQTLLTNNKAKDLEAKSNMYAADDWLASPIQRKTSPKVKRHTSLEKLKECGETKAILM